jgi:hypothetical protein
MSWAPTLMLYVCHSSVLAIATWQRRRLDPRFRYLRFVNTNKTAISWKEGISSPNDVLSIAYIIWIHHLDVVVVVAIYSSVAVRPVPQNATTGWSLTWNEGDAAVTTTGPGERRVAIQNSH